MKAAYSMKSSHLPIVVMQYKKSSGIYNVQMFCILATEFHGLIFSTFEFVTGSWHFPNIWNICVHTQYSGCGCICNFILCF